jgi:signal peptidase II
MFSFGIARYPRLLWLVVVALLIGADQATKAYFSSTLALGSGIEITAWFNLVNVLNTGAAFSFLADAGGWQRYFFIAIGLVCVVAVSFVCLMRKTDNFERYVGAGVVSGGAGNLIDRIQSGAVVDFLDLHWGRLHWPAFNLADVFIVLAFLAWTLLSLQLAIQKKHGHRATGVQA